MRGNVGTDKTGKVGGNEVDRVDVVRDVGVRGRDRGGDAHRTTEPTTPAVAEDVASVSVVAAAIIADAAAGTADTGTEASAPPDERAAKGRDFTGPVGLGLRPVSRVDDVDVDKLLIRDEAALNGERSGGRWGGRRAPMREVVGESDKGVVGNEEALFGECWDSRQGGGRGGGKIKVGH
jgi:hypothetical protein